MRRPLILLASVLSFLMVSCSSDFYETQEKTKGQVYAQLYKEKPTSIVIMPPINKTSNVGAKQYFYTTMHQPLCEKGYYVFSPYLMMEMFQSESAYDSELFINGNLKKFNEVLGTDAAMFTIIKRWDKVQLANIIEVEVEYILKSTKTNEVLWKRSGDVTVDLNIGSEDEKDDLAALLNIVASAINTAVTDQVVAGRKCTEYVLRDLPLGPYAPGYGQDALDPAGVSHISELTL